jgi:hypothetical protein
MTTTVAGEYCSHRNHGKPRCTPGQLERFTVTRVGRTRGPGPARRLEVGRWLCPHHAQVWRERHS